MQDNRPFVYKKIGIEMGKIGQFHVMIATFGVTSLVCPVTKKIGSSIRLAVEKNIAIIMIRKGKIVKTSTCAGRFKVFRFMGCGEKDIIAQNSLLLLPPGLSVVPGQFITAGDWIGHALYNIVPSTSTGILTMDEHLVCAMFCDLKKTGVTGKVIEAGQAPGNLQVVTNNTAILLPGVTVVRLPFGSEPLVDERTFRIGKVSDNEICKLSKSQKVFAVMCPKVEVF